MAEDVEYLKFIQMKRQASTPFMPLINAAQLWMDSANHLQARLHKQGDPGLDVEYKLLDFLYATFFGKCETVTCAATVSLTPGAYNQVYCVLDQDVEFGIASGHEGQELYLILKEDGTGNHEASFGAKFSTISSRVHAPGQYIIVHFIYDAANDIWHEIAGGRGGILRGVAFPWDFKMVDINNYATPMTGLTVSPTISKEGAGFSNLTGTPAVSEIGYGWYTVTAPAVDMNLARCVLRATAPGAAQTDRSIYTE